MLLPETVMSWKGDCSSSEKYDVCNTFEHHTKLTERLRKSLYYGKTPSIDNLSLPVTEVAVEYFREASPCELGQIDNYLASSFSRNACMSSCALMLSLVYIERLRTTKREYLQNVSSSDLFLISMMLASKFLYDEGIDEDVYNSEWAKGAGMDTEDINQLEAEFLNALDWRLFVSSEQFEEVLRAVEKRVACRMSSLHGFCTYNDLTVLTDDIPIAARLRKTVTEFVRMMAMFSVAYTAGMMCVGLTLVAVQQMTVHRPIVTTTEPTIDSTLLPSLSPDQLTSSLTSHTDALQSRFFHHDLSAVDIDVVLGLTPTLDRLINANIHSFSDNGLESDTDSDNGLVHDTGTDMNKETQHRGELSYCDRGQRHCHPPNEMDKTESKIHHHCNNCHQPPTDNDLFATSINTFVSSALNRISCWLSLPRTQPDAPDVTTTSATHVCRPGLCSLDDCLLSDPVCQQWNMTARYDMAAAMLSSQDTINNLADHVGHKGPFLDVGHMDPLLVKG